MPKSYSALLASCLLASLVACAATPPPQAIYQPQLNSDHSHFSRWIESTREPATRPIQSRRADSKLLHRYEQWKLGESSNEILLKHLTESQAGSIMQTLIASELVRSSIPHDNQDLLTEACGRMVKTQKTIIDATGSKRTDILCKLANGQIPLELLKKVRRCGDSATESLQLALVGSGSERNNQIGRFILEVRRCNWNIEPLNNVTKLGKAGTLFPLQALTSALDPELAGVIFQSPEHPSATVIYKAYQHASEILFAH